MKTRKKRMVLIILGAIVLCLALVVSATIAYYQATRKATGIVVMDKGIFFEFGNVRGEDKERELLLTTDEVMSVSVVPNEVVEIKNPYIKPLTNTVPFYLRAKLNYKFYSGDTEITPTDKMATLSELLVLDSANNAFSFAPEFLPDANKEWFYYCANEDYTTAGTNQLTALTEASAQVDIFENTTLTVQNFTTEFGSPNEVTKIDVVLIVEALQAASTSADEYGLPADGEAKGAVAPAATTIDLESGDSLTYILDGSTVEITEITGSNPVISKNDMSFADGKEVTLNPEILNGITTLTVFDKELLDYFAFDYFANGNAEVDYVYTSEELLVYLEENGASWLIGFYIGLPE